MALGALAVQGAAPTVRGAAPARSLLLPEEQKHLSGARQLTFGGSNAECYWRPDGQAFIFQSTRDPFRADQIFTMDADGGDQRLVSTGEGRTTCAYYFADGQRMLYSSTHAFSPDVPPEPDRSRGYVWPCYPTYEVFTARADGSDLQRLTENTAYDAEATICWKTGKIVFTSDRDGDLELYTMDGDGSNVRRITNTLGYDGGAFFSADGTKIVWRASRPKTEAE
ncbi:MAG: TolB family protein, partial [Pirellulales bacterium]